MRELYGVDSMGQTAEHVATELHITRRDQDEFALQSQALAVHAIAHGHFEREIVPVPLPQRSRADASRGRGEPQLFATDEFPRAARDADGLRLATEVMMAAVYVVTPNQRISTVALERLSFASYVVMGLVISLMALQFGGLNSSYMHGLSIVLLARAMMIQAPLLPSAAASLTIAATFPLTLAVAALFDPAVRASWTTLPRRPQTARLSAE